MIEAIRAAAQAEHLDIVGALHEGDKTVVLLGPLQPGFWPHVRGSDELQDGQRNPLDRWSKRVITALARRFEAEALFPSDGPPYPPFISWALASHQAFLSPVGMLVHDSAGLFISYRGALRLSGHLELPEQAHAPCTPCSQPCRSACPVDALSETAYDVDACIAHILGPDSKSCRTQGCAARRACPVSQTYGRLPEQSAFHMRAFLGE